MRLRYMAKKLLKYGLKKWNEEFSRVSGATSRRIICSVAHDRLTNTYIVQQEATDWGKVIALQVREELIKCARDSGLIQRWHKNSFVARLNRDKIQQRMALRDPAAAAANAAAAP